MKKEQSEKVNIGSITGAVGLKGEVKIYHLADDPDVLLQYRSLIIDESIYDIENIRYRKKIPILKLSGVSDRNEAEALVRKDIFVSADMFNELPEGSFYIKDLEGLCVVSADSGETIGILKRVMPGSAQDIYEISTDDGKTLLLPAITEFIIDIIIKDGVMKVRLPDGIEETKY